MRKTSGGAALVVSARHQHGGCDHGCELGRCHIARRTRPVSPGSEEPWLGLPAVRGVTHFGPRFLPLLPPRGKGFAGGERLDRGDPLERPSGRWRTVRRRQGNPGGETETWRMVRMRKQRPPALMLDPGEHTWPGCCLLVRFDAELGEGTGGTWEATGACQWAGCMDAVSTPPPGYPLGAL
ncbi:hypothetical protein NDU88_001457 [Pleurodeles waltl]|uniref:Uncharacterized protein n=1 Tax=Pleurodeles waltl TaxID=8319 RepID=A0AAV7U6F2_PLEWA|nr:hypothetical protein NDU88_001457 [Pleurodeles waltl]